MKRFRTFHLILATCLLSSITASAQSYRAEATDALPAGLPKAVQEMLQPSGARLLTAEGAAVCEVWLRKEVPTQAASESADILFGAIAEGTLIGVLHFPSVGSDYRGQPIKPGLYTLRYALIPQDGNHMGVNPYRDSLVLTPVAVDADPAKSLKFEELVKLGRESSGTAHPGFLIMSPVTGDGSTNVVQDDAGHWNLELKLHGQSGDIPIAITLVGKWEG